MDGVWARGLGGVGVEWAGVRPQAATSSRLTSAAWDVRLAATDFRAWGGDLIPATIAGGRD